MAIMAAFHAVNSGLAQKDHPIEHQGEARTPTTPRPTTVEHPADLAGHGEDESTPNTPTRHSFGGLTGQRPLPTSPLPSSVTPQHSGTTRLRQGALTRENSHRSVQSTGSQDVDMDDSQDGEDGSGDESGGESGRPSKKKKGQRFFCTDFPPCTLSFTRSEHLARHIRYDPMTPVFDPLSLKSHLLQETYGGATLSVPLCPPLLTLGQSTATCADCACQRRDTGRFTCGLWLEIPAADTARTSPAARPPITGLHDWKPG